MIKLLNFLMFNVCVKIEKQQQQKVLLKFVRETKKNLNTLLDSLFSIQLYPTNPIIQ